MVDLPVFPELFLKKKTSISPAKHKRCDAACRTVSQPSFRTVSHARKGAGMVIGPPEEIQTSQTSSSSAFSK